jgi:hypothetical protein
VIHHVSLTTAWTAASAASPGSTLPEAIIFVAIAVVAVLVILVMLGRASQRLALPSRLGRRSARDEGIKRAAAADVAAMEEDAKFISPDAPGVQEDDL